MYCPYCKNEMVWRNKELYCGDGNCYFSQRVSNYFVDKIKELKLLVHQKIYNLEKKIGHFYCVNCGSKLIKIDGMHEICLSCGFEINKSVYYQIIERNPHGIR